MLRTTVENIMTEDVVKISKEATVMDAAHILLRFQINGILVVEKKDSDKVIGILTTTDLLKFLNKALSKHAHKMSELDRIAKLPLKNVVSKNVVKIQKNEKLTKIIAIMHRKNIHTLPVYNGKKLVGVIGKHDILNVAFYPSKYS